MLVGLTGEKGFKAIKINTPLSQIYILLGFSLGLSRNYHGLFLGLFLGFYLVISGSFSRVIGSIFWENFRQIFGRFFWGYYLVDYLKLKNIAPAPSKFLKPYQDLL
jgi:hypothetical protein